MDESTPLLPPPSPPPPPRPTRSYRKFFIIILSIIAIFTSLLVLLVYSYVPRNTDPDFILQHALVFEGPGHIDVLNISSNGEIWLTAQARIGIDATPIINIGTSDNDALPQRIWKYIGSWGVRRLQSVSIGLSGLSLSSKQSGSVLACLDSQPVEIPLAANPPEFSWLRTISIPILVKPTQNTTVLVDFVRDSWRDGMLSVIVKVDSVDVRAGYLDGHDWRSLLRQTMSDVQTHININIPHIPGVPGRDAPAPSLADLISVQEFHVSSISTESLAIHAQATLIDPAPDSFNLTTPYLPFIVSLNPPSSSPVPIASVATAPFHLTHPNITLLISGSVLPLSSDATAPLSSFVTKYIKGVSNPIIITSPLLPGLNLDVVFPGADPVPHILRNVTIHDMKIKPGTPFHASGTVYARIVLPPGFELELDVQRVLPDVLIFDGEVPDGAETYTPVPPSPPLPDPLPPRAFGHIRPDDWLNSTCVPDTPGDGEGSAFAIRAEIVNVELQVLPGREKEFSNFVSKVVFGTHGAIAGIQGTAAVNVVVQGLPVHSPEHGSGLELSGLPFQGSVRVGQKVSD